MSDVDIMICPDAAYEVDWALTAVTYSEGRLTVVTVLCWQILSPA